MIHEDELVLIREDIADLRQSLFILCFEVNRIADLVTKLAELHGLLEKEGDNSNGDISQGLSRTAAR